MKLKGHYGSSVNDMVHGVQRDNLLHFRTPLLFGLMLTVAVTLTVTLGEYKSAIDSTQFA